MAVSQSTLGNEADQRSDRKLNRPATWILICTAALLGKFDWSRLYLSTDEVNLAYALESFDPKSHQPQPPGYPLFVAVARLVDWFISSPETTFVIISILVTVASAAVLYRIAERMVSRWAAAAAVILFLLNPVLWFTRLQSPLRPWLALFSSLIAYSAWRCWNGERRFIWWGAVALGVGAGFRPDLLAYLFPLWAVSAWKATRSWRPLAQGSLIIGAFCAVWMSVIVYAMGGMASSAEVLTSYLTAQSSKDSILFASAQVWLRPISRLLLWNATAIVGWVWVPLALFRTSTFKDPRWSFLLLWILPGLILQLLVHIAAPGHTLFATPGWCLMGAYFIYRVGERRDLALGLAGAISAGLFLNLVPTGYPPPPEAKPWERMWTSVKNSIAYGTFETSLERLRWWDETAEVSIRELSRFAVPDRPNLVIILNGNDLEFDFVNWRVVSYYLNDRPLWVLMDNLAPQSAGRIRQVRRHEVRSLNSRSISIPESARILWVMLPGGRFHRALQKLMPVQAGRYILYTDPPYTLPFEIEGFQFVPAGAQEF